MPTKSIYIASTLDTKGDEVLFVKKQIEKAGIKVVAVDLSTKSKRCCADADISAVQVAAYHPDGEDAVFCGDRGRAINAMSEAFKHFILARENVAGILGLGGSGGTALITPAMQALPIGLPKLMVSTMASGNISNYVGVADIAMMYSVTDVAGINRISRLVLSNAANFMTGAVYFKSNTESNEQDKPALGLTMFGVTTPCIKFISQALHHRFDCLVFHATGSGGKSMERLAENQLLDGLLDITTTEICDYLFGGVLACDENRLDVVAQTKLPYIGSCGALDMINFGHIDSIPEQYRNRLFYPHNAQVTLMRTTADENRQLAEWIGRKLNKCEGSVKFVIPEKGFSALDAEGMPFYDPEANQAFIDTLYQTVKQTPMRQLITLPYHINDEEFAAEIIKLFNQQFSD
ncbi:uncharacterized protein (UPF0261 family) [Cricetibacter osteomyelitidis]|uniref:UPF0261 protein EDC44_14610 n=1 Tax=Cricetibacter osteomyelitidis TaxID=1521931 RepID=A0A4R2SGQ8_9PAST|nr:Tm-1-like ATP-binding domain-containing protein [Cricetibacter osteomyelitidis]TCP88819.1 uncharacterized protein (UPF0261 family) [Cricetibacter osteomyelitidis]